MADITVTVSEDHLGRIHDVAAALRANGMVVRQVLDGIGVISGWVPQDGLAALGALDGVEAVEDENRFSLPPPDSPVQ